ncbi:MAG: ATP-binding protein, partial [Capsulimonas sp.]|uniref:GAF domain-containing sensor histidine kinase n=1 Tax=Capsulimonas sp. TaxID=2494211 RepID=UPI003266AF4D
TSDLDPVIDPQTLSQIQRLADAACANDRVIGLGEGQHLWAKAVSGMDVSPESLGVYIPLHAADTLVGVLHVGPRADGRPYSALEERLILTLANHAAVVIARDLLAQQASEATALREADTLKDALVSLVSHELRTPLAAIKASVSGLLQPDAVWSHDARQEALIAIDSEADRLSGVVNNLLDLSRLEAGAWLPRKDWCDLAEVAGTALDRLPASEASRVTLDAEDDLPLASADYTQIALVLTNLLENAIKYTPPASPIQLTLKSSRDGSEPGVLATVRDFGAGLAPGEEGHLFERFYRGQTHQGGPIHGTGLGLALCQSIVLAHGGRIWASNAPAGEPRGAVFSFFLPKG